MRRKISGKNEPIALKHVTKNKTEAITKKNIADTLIATFSANSLLNNSNPQFLIFKINAEKQKLNFKINNSEKYTQPFTPAELKEAIQEPHKIAVDPNKIHFDFLEHLPKIDRTTF